MTILVQQQITEADRKQLRELCGKATQGAWWIDSHGHRLMSMDRIQTIFIADNKAMGPAVRNQETGNLSHWPNDWDASYIVAVQPKVVRSLLDEIDRLSALVIERETIRIGQSLQRHDDQKQIDELVALGIQQDKDEIERLKAENSSLREALADKVVDSAKLRTFLPADGGFTIGVEGGPCALLADAFGEQLYTSDAINYLQLTFTSGAYPDLGEIVVTLQRCTGKTPHELRIDAEQERDQLKAENVELSRDAERYRWLREGKNDDGPNMVAAYATGELDSAIDRVMTKEQP